MTVILLLRDVIAVVSLLFGWPAHGCHALGEVGRRRGLNWLFDLLWFLCFAIAAFLTLGHDVAPVESRIHGDELLLLGKQRPRRCGELRGRKTLVVLSCIKHLPSQGLAQAASTSVVGAHACDAELCFSWPPDGSGSNASGYEFAACRLTSCRCGRQIPVQADFLTFGQTWSCRRVRPRRCERRHLLNRLQAR